MMNVMEWMWIFQIKKVQVTNSYFWSCQQYTDNYIINTVQLSYSRCRNEYLQWHVIQEYVKIRCCSENYLREEKFRLKKLDQFTFRYCVKCAHLGCNRWRRVVKLQSYDRFHIRKYKKFNMWLSTTYEP